MSSWLRFLILAAALLVAGCSYVSRIGVYKLEINQGNYVTQDMVDKLKPGMSKAQVKLVLGTPLVADAFHVNRWDYVYQLEKDGKVVTLRRFVVYFADEKLSTWEGEPAPPTPAYAASVIQQNASSNAGDSKPAPASDEPGFFGRLWEKWGW